MSKKEKKLLKRAYKIRVFIGDITDIIMGAVIVSSPIILAIVLSIIFSSEKMG